jgi:uncharacterized protein YndB with AHSA1/START domain
LICARAVRRFLEIDDAEKTVGLEGKNLEIAPNRRLVFTWSKVIADTSGEKQQHRCSPCAFRGP